MIGTGSLGSSAALAPDGYSAFVAELFDGTGVGAAWWFVNRALVTTISPLSGPARGGTQVTIVGTDFKKAADVHFERRPPARSPPSSTVTSAASTAQAVYRMRVPRLLSGGTKFT